MAAHSVIRHPEQPGQACGLKTLHELWWSTELQLCCSKPTVHFKVQTHCLHSNLYTLTYFHSPPCSHTMGYDYFRDCSKGQCPHSPWKVFTLEAFPATLTSARTHHLILAHFTLCAGLTRAASKANPMELSLHRSSRSSCPRCGLP